MANNQTGRGGFQDNPQNINTGGRPPKGYSITDWFREMLKSKPEIKDAIGMKIVEKALSGDSAAQKLIWNYMDGLPKSNNEDQKTLNIYGNVNIQNIRSMTDEQIRAEIARIEEREKSLLAGTGNEEVQG